MTPDTYTEFYVGETKIRVSHAEYPDIWFFSAPGKTIKTKERPDGAFEVYQ